MSWYSNLTLLAALDSRGQQQHQRAYVETVKSWYQLERTSTATADGISIVTATNGGRWIRDISSVAPDWSLQATWYIDPTNGSDEFTGTSATIAGTVGPIKTFAELVRRIGPQVIRTKIGVTVNLLGSTSECVDLLVDTRASTTGGFIVQGLLVQQYQGTLTAVTSMNSSTQTPTSATASWNPTTELNRLVIDTQTSSYAWVAKDTGSGSARLSPWNTMNLTGGAVGPVSLTNASVNDQVTTYTMPSVGSLSVTGFDAAIGGANPTPIIFNNLEITGATGRPRFDSTGAQICFQNCLISTNTPRINGGVIVFNNCCLTCPGGAISGSDLNGQWILNCGLVTNGQQITISLGRTSTNNTLFQNASILAQRGVELSIVGDTSFFDNATFSAIQLLNPSSMVIVQGTRLWGNNNVAYGVTLEGGSRVIYDSTLVPSLNSGLGVGREILVANTEKLWSEMPYSESATGTFVTAR